jgi:hypothetical protein
MKNTRFLILAAIVILAAGCASKGSSEFTTVKVKEVEQVAQYTYLLVKGDGKEFWVAVPTMNASPGETYHYQGGMMMQDFESKELGKTFDEVLFVEALFKGDGSSIETSQDVQPDQAMTSGGKATVEKTDVTIERVEGTVSIADLYANPGAYEGKVIQVQGKVAKFSPAIMSRNWIHIQDGTEHEGNYDLTVTSPDNFQVDDVVIVEGVVALNIDFGYGYSYEILLEEAKAVK